MNANHHREAATVARRTCHLLAVAGDRCQGTQSSCGHVLGTFTPPLLLQPQSQYNIPTPTTTHNPAVSGLADKQVQYVMYVNQK